MNMDEAFSAYRSRFDGDFPPRFETFYGPAISTRLPGLSRFGGVSVGARSVCITGRCCGRHLSSGVAGADRGVVGTLLGALF